MVIPESQGIHVKKEDVVLTVVSLIPNGVSALKVGRVLFEVFGKLTKCGCYYKVLHCWYRFLITTLLFGINCTEMNQSQSSNPFMCISIEITCSL